MVVLFFRYNLLDYPLRTARADALGSQTRTSITSTWNPNQQNGMVMKLRYSTYISYACCMLHIHQKLFGWGTGKPPRKTLCICMFASRCPSDEGSGASLLVGNGCRVFGLPWSSILHYSKVCFPSQGAAAAAVEESSNPAERSASSASGLFEDLGREQYRGGT